MSLRRFYDISSRCYFKVDAGESCQCCFVLSEEPAAIDTFLGSELIGKFSASMFERWLVSRTMMGL